MTGFPVRVLAHAGPDHESAIGLIAGRNWAGDDPERVREGMSGNLCRCGAYAGITDAVLDAQRTLAQLDRKDAA